MYQFTIDDVTYNLEIVLQNPELLTITCKNLKSNKKYRVQINNKYVGGSLCNIGTFSNDMSVNYDKRYCTCNSYLTYFDEKIRQNLFTLQEYDELDLIILNIDPIEIIMDNINNHNNKKHILKTKFDLLLKKYNNM
jgi:hypothetical protein